MGKPEDNSGKIPIMQTEMRFTCAEKIDETYIGQKNETYQRANLGRRAYVSMRTYEEAAIKKIIELIEKMPADVRLSRAQMSLCQAFDCLADYNDGFYNKQKYEFIATNTPPENKDKSPVKPEPDVHDPVCYLIVAAWSSPECPVYLGFTNRYQSQITWVTPSDEEFALEFATPLSAEIFLEYARHWDSTKPDSIFPGVVPTPKIIPFYDNVGPLHRPIKKDKF